MRWLVIISVVAAALYSGYWFVGARAVENGIATAVTDARTQGWDISYDSLNTAGFPSRFDTSVANLAVTTPDGQITYNTPFFQAFALSYRPNEIIAAFAPTQSATIAGQDVTLTSDSLMADAAVAANTDLAFRRATLSGTALTLQSVAFGTLRVGTMIAAARETEAPATYDLYLDLTGVVLPDALRGMLNPDSALPDTLSQVTLGARAVLAQPLDRTTENPELQALRLTGTRLNWGDLTLSMSGDLTVPDTRNPEGQIVVTVENWRLLTPMLVGAGAVPSEIAQTLDNMFAALSQGSDTLELPLDIVDGQIALGPFPLGSLPKF